MSDNEHDRPLIRNEDTLRRRAWIDRALAGVRHRLAPHELGAPSTPPVEPAVSGSDGVKTDGASSDGDDAAAGASRPRLYLVRNPD